MNNITAETREAQDDSREKRFVDTVLGVCARDKGQAAHLRRADNPATEYQAWELLARFGVNLNYQDERLAYVLVAANVAKDKLTDNGNATLGQALAACYDEGNQSKQATARLRRLLACDDMAEITRILRPMLSMVRSRSRAKLDYVNLLKQLKQFRFDSNRIKARWAQEFYRQDNTQESR